MTSAGSLFGSGAVASAAILLILAGAGKLTAAGRPSGPACRLPLIGSRWCLPAQAGAGAAECGVGAVVCLGLLPVAGGAALTALGLAFAAVTGYLLAARRQSDCGCVRWKHAEHRVTGRAVARAGCVLAAGVADLWAGPPRPGYWASAWFGLGVLAGAVILAALTVRADLRSPGCRRHLLWPARDALRALTSHPVFKEVAGAGAVPPRSAFAHRRNGCADVFHLREPGHPRQGTLFEVSRSADGLVAVRAEISNRAETHNRKAHTGVLSSQDDRQETGRRRTSCALTRGRGYRHWRRSRCSRAAPGRVRRSRRPLRAAGSRPAPLPRARPPARRGLPAPPLPPQAPLPPPAKAAT